MLHAACILSHIKIPHKFINIPSVFVAYLSLNHISWLYIQYMNLFNDSNIFSLDRNDLIKRKNGRGILLELENEFQKIYSFIIEKAMGNTWEISISGFDRKDATSAPSYRGSINRAGDRGQREIGEGRRKTSAPGPFVPPVV